MKYIFILLIFILASCAKEQPQVSWLKIEKWELVQNNNADNYQGELTHDLSQVFVNMDGKSLGVFELPVKIPIIGEGTHDFVLIPGIVNNGIGETKRRYPFAEQYKNSITLTLNDTVSITPTTKYYSTLNFLIEDFESPSMQVDVSEESTATIGRNDDPSILKWGSKYGEILLDEENSSLSFVTTFGTVLPKLATEVYLEFDYMNTNSLLTSVISHGNGNYFVDPYILIQPQKENQAKWKHIYIDLKEIVSFRQTTPINEIQFELQLDDVNPSSYFYIDNIKLIYP